jgi:lactoylglutathione lyase
MLRRARGASPTRPRAGGRAACRSRRGWTVRRSVGPCACTRVPDPAGVGQRSTRRAALTARRCTADQPRPHPDTASRFPAQTRRFRESAVGDSFGKTTLARVRQHDGGAAGFPLVVPFRESIRALKRHREGHVRHAAGVACSRAQARTTQARPSESAAMNDTANVMTVDHTGFAVSSLDEAIRFWTGALGFTLERQSEMGGDFLHQVTGVDNPSVTTAIVRAPSGYVVELLQYSKGRQNGVVRSSAGAIGAAHLALTVKDIHAATSRCSRMEGEG